ncbi:MAG: universal stress protein [Pirellulaceae bacterium]
MSFKRILCPVDLSPSSDQAIRVASSIAKGDAAKLLFLHVAMPELPLSASSAIPEVNHALAIEKEKFLQIRPCDGGVDCEHLFVRGEPVEVILDTVKKQDVDLIVMPTHGRTGLARLLMGSVAEKVVRLASCPVLVVKTPDQN